MKSRSVAAPMDNGTEERRGGGGGGHEGNEEEGGRETDIQTGRQPETDRHANRVRQSG